MLLSSENIRTIGTPNRDSIKYWSYLPDLPEGFEEVIVKNEASEFIHLDSIRTFSFRLFDCGTVQILSCRKQENNRVGRL